MDDFVHIGHGRSPEQVALMKKIQADGVCPFCWGNLEKYHPKPVLKKTEWWLMTENMSPYGNIPTHYIFIYKNHVTALSEISPEGYADLFKLIATIETEQQLVGGTFMIRFGKPTYTGGSVSHLHAHLISGVDQSEGDAVRVKVGYSNSSNQHE